MASLAHHRWIGSSKLRSRFLPYTTRQSGQSVWLLITSGFISVVRASMTQELPTMGPFVDLPV